MVLMERHRLELGDLKCAKRHQRQHFTLVGHASLSLSRLHQNPCHQLTEDATPLPHRSRFVLTNLVHIAANLAAAQLLTRFFFCPLYPSHINTPPAFLALPLWRQHAISTAQLALSTRFLDTTYRVFATCAVLLGLSPPAANPACFGSLADVWSVRTFWGRTWHQTFRTVFVAVGDAVAGACRARQGTRASRYLKTYAGFATSGAMHALPGLFVRHAGAPWWTVTNLLHMPLYAVVVTVEDGVKGVGRRLGVRGKYSFFFTGKAEADCGRFAGGSTCWVCLDGVLGAVCVSVCVCVLCRYWVLRWGLCGGVS